ncbi:hypothetical protein PRIPAC_89073 [Pristionchus pacificus]|uniref:Uncharacterized protein n=1 Tax=Pristionchus pacificus TaxID=54126 RepID=A0A2A6B5T8_PRIPA|nr:hypothetical protein PRIPAC_89073 [Pristionchus pacificus]|eukprot:PDM61221.1 hypothetical protein PRIPAC_50663 [Pristionchus pacificus]
MISQAMHTEKDQLIISFLPSDIIRKIIKIGYEFVDEFRLVSPLWNSLALDHFSKLPLLKWLRLRPTGHYSSEPVLPEKIRVNKACSRIERLETDFSFLNQRKFYTAFKYSMTGVIVDELYLQRKYLWDFDMTNILTALDDFNVINLVMFSSNVYMQDLVEPIIIAARRFERRYEQLAVFQVTLIVQAMSERGKSNEETAHANWPAQLAYDN